MLQRVLCILIIAISLAPSRGGIAEPVTEKGVDVALVLAVDISGSVNDDRFGIQMRGYAHAICSSEVIQTIRKGRRGKIAITIVQWADADIQVISMPWRVVKDEISAKQVSAEIEALDREPFGFSTSISGAIDFSARLLASLPFFAERLVIDVSGDGSNNSGRFVDLARDEAVQQGIVINGIVMVDKERGVEKHYRRHVIGGLGAFVIAVSDHRSFGPAVRRKLVLEIASR